MEPMLTEPLNLISKPSIYNLAMPITSEDQIIVHDNFSAKTGINDIALIRLNELVTLFSEDPTESFITPGI